MMNDIMIARQRYNQLMDYLALKTRELNTHELKEIKENPNNKRNPELHNIWQSRFPITQCHEYVASGFIICWNNKFWDTNKLYERCIEIEPDAFQTGNAWDIVKCLYDNSRYHGTIEEYDTYLRTEGCCYIVLNFGDMFDEILRIDLYRQLDIRKNSNQYEFTGGLFHCLKHFSKDGKNLCNSNDINETFDIFHIVEIIGCTFKDAVAMDTNEGVCPIDDDHYYKGVFYKEDKDTNIYFVKSLRKEAK